MIGARRGPRKIGVATSPSARLTKLATGSAVPIRVLYEAPVPAEIARDVEAFAHALLATRHQHGEWFRVSLDEAVSAIREAIAAVERGERARKKSVGRPPLWSENMQARFAAGTFARIAAVLQNSEDRTDFVRQAVEAELARREKP